MLPGPEFVEIIKWGTNNCETFGPHLFVEERSNTSNPVAGDAILPSSRLELPVDGKLEKASSEELNVVEKP